MLGGLFVEDCGDFVVFEVVFVVLVGIGVVEFVDVVVVGCVVGCLYDLGVDVDWVLGDGVGYCVVFDGVDLGCIGVEVDDGDFVFFEIEFVYGVYDVDG